MNRKSEVEKLIKKIVKKSKDGDSYYFYGVEYASDQKQPQFKAFIGWTKEGVQPLQFAESSITKLIKALDHYLTNSNRIDVKIRWHEFMIDTNERAAQVHRDFLTNYRKSIDAIKSGEVSSEDLHSQE